MRGPFDMADYTPGYRTRIRQLETENERLRDENTNLAEELRDASPGWLQADVELKRLREVCRQAAYELEGIAEWAYIGGDIADRLRAAGRNA